MLIRISIIISLPNDMTRRVKTIARLVMFGTDEGAQLFIWGKVFEKIARRRVGALEVSPLHVDVDKLQISICVWKQKLCFHIWGYGLQKVIFLRSYERFILF